MVIDAILLAVMLAIIALNILLGPRAYRLLASRLEQGRTGFYRRMLRGQLLLFTLPPIVALLVLGRLDAIVRLPIEFVRGSAFVGFGYPTLEPDPFSIAMFAISLAIAIPLSIWLALRRKRKGKPPRKPIGNVSALLPRNRGELGYGVLISVAAGLGEELFFRLALPILLTAFVGQVVAMPLAIILFGLVHLYQGWKGVFATTLVGVVLTGIYLLSGTIATAIMLHITIDLMALVVRPAMQGAWNERSR